jgi:RHS repeat-associated protein
MRSSPPPSGYSDRYGYQGEYAECDPETATTSGSEAIGGWNSFDLRMYDANVGRWLSPDPKKQFWSAYEGMGNNPINGVDPDGGGVLDDITYNSATKTQTVTPTNDNYDRYFVDGTLVGFGTKGKFTFSQNGYMMQKSGETGGKFYLGSSSDIQRTLTTPGGVIRHLNESQISNTMFRGVEVAGQYLQEGGTIIMVDGYALAASAGVVNPVLFEYGIAKGSYGALATSIGGGLEAFGKAGQTTGQSKMLIPLLVGELTQSGVERFGIEQPLSGAVGQGVTDYVNSLLEQK